MQAIVLDRDDITPQFIYKGYTVKREYGGWGVNGTLYETKEAAKAWIDQHPKELNQ